MSDTAPVTFYAGLSDPIKFSQHHTYYKVETAEGISYRYADHIVSFDVKQDEDKETALKNFIENTQPHLAKRFGKSVETLFITEHEPVLEGSIPTNASHNPLLWSGPGYF